jgi:hypothetical protein
VPKIQDQTTLAQQSSLLQMQMQDDAFVILGTTASDGGINFTDEGYMPVTGLTLGGGPLHMPAGLDGAFIHYYHAYGEQYLDANTQVRTIKYTDLQYDLVGYKGNAQFGHDPVTGAATVDGLKQTFELAHGSLLPGQGQLVADPYFNITGQVNVSVLVGMQRVGELDISVAHAGLDTAHPDVGFTSTGGITLSDGNLSAKFVAVHA